MVCWAAHSIGVLGRVWGWVMIMGICPDANASTAKKTVKNEQPLKLK